MASDLVRVRLGTMAVRKIFTGVPETPFLQISHFFYSNFHNKEMGSEARQPEEFEKVAMILDQSL